jgi:hypothetical protein
MGRYYVGDIEGKFWFGLQSSDAAGRFGGEEREPQYIEYYFDEEHLEEVNEEIDRIIVTLGDKKKIIEDFFENNESYVDKSLEAIGVTQNLFRDYADLKLGIKIRDCIIEKGQCCFQAEL